MKIRNGFVSNSSSSSFLLKFTSKPSETEIEEIPNITSGLIQKVKFEVENTEKILKFLSTLDEKYKFALKFDATIWRLVEEYCNEHNISNTDYKIKSDIEDALDYLDSIYKYELDMNDFNIFFTTDNNYELPIIATFLEHL